jgi:hypothetical protein
MQITINIDDHDLKTAVERGITALSTETISDLAKEALTAYMMDPKNMRELVFRKSSYGYSNEPVLRDYVQKMIANSFSAEEISKYRQKLFDVIENHGDQLLTSTLAQTFSNMLMSEPVRIDLAQKLTELAHK